MSCDRLTGPNEPDAACLPDLSAGQNVDEVIRQIRSAIALYRLTPSELGFTSPPKSRREYRKIRAAIGNH